MAYTTIDNPEEYFITKLYTGGNGSATTISGLEFQPDMAWVKGRSNTGVHGVMDSTRSGANGHGWLRSESTDAENNTSGRGNISSWTSDGFVLSADSWHAVNYGTNTHVSWSWKANGGTRTTNTESGDNPGGGYQANTTAGFSIVDYTGTGATGTMAHGLGAVPDFYMIKNREEVQDWMGYHVGTASDPETDGIRLNTTDALTDAATFWNDTAPTSTVFTVNTSTNVNKDAITYIAYCFKSIQGYSKFGSYTGNGNADGPFVYTGFKPAWIMVKRSESTGTWRVIDVQRNSYNGVFSTLVANSDEDDYTEDDDFGNTDILSNGFKLRQNYSHVNATGGTYIYMAFAHQPFVTSGGVPCTAR